MHHEKASLPDKNSDKPHAMPGALYLKRSLFDKLISAFYKAVSINPDDENKTRLDTAYAEKKKSLGFQSNAQQIVLKDLNQEQMFSAAYKPYAESPVGRMRMQRHFWLSCNQ